MPEAFCKYHILDGCFNAMYPIPGADEPIFMIIDETNPVFTMPLYHQATIWHRGIESYKVPDDIFDELTKRIKNIGVELPDDFPLCGYIGVLQGIKVE